MKWWLVGGGLLKVVSSIMPTPATVLRLTRKVEGDGLLKVVSSIMPTPARVLSLTRKVEGDGLKL